MQLKHCTVCIRYFGVNNKGRVACSAFPKGIPQDILEGVVAHTVPYPGDNGETFHDALEPLVPTVEKT